MKIAFLACPATLPGSPTRRPDAFEHDLYVEAVRAGVGTRGTVTEIDWRAPLEQLAGFDAAILGTPWDYTEAKDEFLARLTELEQAGVTVCNPVAVVRWNSDKLYLKELGERGAVTIPTLWPERAGPADVLAGFDHFGTEFIYPNDVRTIATGRYSTALDACSTWAQARSPFAAAYFTVTTRQPTSPNISAPRPNSRSFTTPSRLWRL